MFGSFRLAMAWVHTWFGLVLGSVLMVVFFFGSLSVFDREIDRWAIPETRFTPQPMPSFDRTLRPIFETIQPDADELAAARARLGSLAPALPVRSWSAYTTHRDPVLSLYAELGLNNPRDPTDHVHGHVTIDPRSGKLLSHDRLKIGSEFFYPMHFSLHLAWLELGYWVVGLAALAMLVGLVSGVVIHRKLFRELFTFRPQQSAQRSALDLHNLSGVAALPFHFMFAFSGLVIFSGVYFPLSTSLLQPLAQAHARQQARSQGLPFAPAGVPAQLASVDRMLLEAKRRWQARGMPGEVGLLEVHHVGDANAYVSVFRAGRDRVSLLGQAVHFAGTSGQVLYEQPPAGMIEGTRQLLTGLHLQHFEHWPLRWLYVFGGLSGCTCIATGLVLFVGKRRRKHAAQGVGWTRQVEALVITSVTGMVAATLCMLVANRLLPVDLPARAAWEQRSFWLSWLLALAHAALRTAPAKQARLAPAWREQAWAIAALAVSAALLNWITTGDHLLSTVARGAWDVAGVDLALLCSALVAGAASLQLGAAQRRAAVPEQGALDEALAPAAGASHG